MVSISVERRLCTVILHYTITVPPSLFPEYGATAPAAHPLTKCQRLAFVATCTDKSQFQYMAVSQHQGTGMTAASVHTDQVLVSSTLLV